MCPALEYNVGLLSYVYIKSIWEDGIRMDLREIGWRDADWIRLAQDRDRWRVVVNVVMNFRVLAPRS
jgi:hypothetical protein